MRALGLTVRQAIRLLDELGSGSDPIWCEHEGVRYTFVTDLDGSRAEDATPEALRLRYYARPPRARKNRLVRGTLAGMVRDRLRDVCCKTRRRDLLVMAREDAL